jgi:N-acylneuraminate cytidylyltransferase
VYVQEVVMARTVALIPARGGSKRVPGKNIRLLHGEPLIAYTISAAIESREFDHILVSSDHAPTLELASRLGTDVLKRPAELATDTSPDIDWVTHALSILENDKGEFDQFSILRPTSPFRTADTIRRAFSQWRTASQDDYSSLRAVEPVAQHPGKMWRLHAQELVPLLPQPSPQPWHDSQYASLPPIYVQNACIEIARSSVVHQTNTISGQRVLPFFTTGNEGLDINCESDWTLAEVLLQRGEATLPRLNVRRGA